MILTILTTSFISCCLASLVQDDPTLLAYIKKDVMKEPSPYEVAYNLSKNLSKHYLNGQVGQAVEIEKIFKGK